MAISPTLFSSRSEEWPTPLQFFESLDDEFDFTLDPCATRQNAKCRRYFTKQQNGLDQDWKAHRVFCNPPYGACRVQRPLGRIVRSLLPRGRITARACQPEPA